VKFGNFQKTDNTDPIIEDKNSGKMSLPEQTTPSENLPVMAMYPPDCFRRIQTTFFQEKTILTALSFYRYLINESQWTPVAKELVAANSRIPSLMKIEAKRYPRNPLERPFQPEVAQDILRAAARTAFVEVMKNNYITNPHIINGMFTYIWNQNSGRVQDCLK